MVARRHDEPGAGHCLDVVVLIEADDSARRGEPTGQIAGERAVPVAPETSKRDRRVESGCERVDRRGDLMDCRPFLLELLESR